MIQAAEAFLLVWDACAEERLCQPRGPTKPSVPLSALAWGSPEGRQQRWPRVGKAPFLLSIYHLPQQDQGSSVDILVGNEQSTAAHQLTICQQTWKF